MFNTRTNKTTRNIQSLSTGDVWSILYVTRDGILGSTKLASSTTGLSKLPLHVAFTIICYACLGLLCGVKLVTARCLWPLFAQV